MSGFVAGIIIGLFLGGGLGFTSGWATRGQRLKMIEQEIEDRERARQQGQIDSLMQQRQRPTLDPPSNFYGRH